MRKGTDWRLLSAKEAESLLVHNLARPTVLDVCVESSNTVIVYNSIAFYYIPVCAYLFMHSMTCILYCIPLYYIVFHFIPWSCIAYFGIALVFYCLFQMDSFLSGCGFASTSSSSSLSIGKKESSASLKTVGAPTPTDDSKSKRPVREGDRPCVTSAADHMTL